MRIVVDRDRCTGQRMCESIAPDIFRVADDGKVKIQVAVVPDGQPGDKYADGQSDPRTCYQTGRAYRHDARIEPAGLSDNGFFDQSENHEN